MPSLSEDDLIARYFAPLAGPGGLGLKDDAALVQVPDGYELVITKDMLVAGVHFFPHDPPADIARKALRVNLSDLAAKGAEPLGFLLGLAMSSDTGPEWLEPFAGGLGADSASYGLPLLGGDTVRTSGPLMISITALGLVPMGQMVRRTHVQAGDILFVSGTIGDAALGLSLRENAGAALLWQQSLTSAEQAFLLDRYLLPRPRNGLALLLRQYAHAAMDVSDGFIGDMRKMLRASGIGGRIDLANIPVSSAGRSAMRREAGLFQLMLTGGDDYEIIFSVPRAHIKSFESAAKLSGIATSRVGEAGGHDVDFVDDKGQDVPCGQGSFSHF